jgi:hypothetical protein
MIWEPSLWKSDLLRKARDLRIRKTQTRWPEASLANLEKSLMVGFYSVRKLIEADKVATSIKRETIALIEYPATGKKVTKLNWHRVEELYDLNKPKTVTRNALFICNQFVHSFVFLTVFNDMSAASANPAMTITAAAT